MLHISDFCDPVCVGKKTSRATIHMIYTFSLEVSKRVEKGTQSDGWNLPVFSFQLCLGFLFLFCFLYGLGDLAEFPSQLGLGLFYFELYIKRALYVF